MQKTIKCIFQNVKDAEKAISDIIYAGVRGSNITLSAEQDNLDINASVPKGTYGSFYNSAAGTLQDKETASPDQGVMLAAGPYAGLYNDDNPSNVSFLSDIGTQNRNYITLRVSAGSGKIAEIASIFKKYNGQKISVVK